MKTVGKVKSTIILIVTAVFAVLFGAIIAFAPAANPMGGGGASQPNLPMR